MDALNEEVSRLKAAEQMHKVNIINIFFPIHLGNVFPCVYFHEI